MNALRLTPQEWSALLLSLRVSLLVWAVMIIPGIAFGWLLARKQFWGKTFVDAVVHLPLVMPPVAMGYLLLILLGRRGLIGEWLESTFGISVAFTWRAAVIAAAAMGFPLLVRAVRLSIE